MHGQIDAARKQRLFDFLREEALPSGLCKRGGLQMIPGGLNDGDASLHAALLEQRRDVVRLPERELGSARADGQLFHC